MSAAHDGQQSHHYVVHFPEHPARTDDPHYVDFDHYHRKTRATARCYVGERVGFGDCKDAQGSPCVIDAEGQQSGLELHHAHVEFSLQNGISLEALEKDYPGISNPNDLGAWVETAANFRWLCVTPWTLVLMADGSHRRIEGIRPGDAVVGHDGRSHLVTACGKRPYQGPIILPTAHAGLTPGHEMLTNAGWLASGQIMRQIRVFGSDVFSLGTVQSQVVRGIIRAIPVDVVDPLGRHQWTAKDTFHDRSMFHDQAVAVPNATVPGCRHLRSALALVPFRQLVQDGDAASVGTVAHSAATTRTVELGAAVFAASISDSTEPTRARLTAGGFGVGRKIPAAIDTPMLVHLDTPIETATYSGYVHDISIAESHSFIAGGIAVHNCVFHHRGPGGAHTASHSDWEAQQYVLGLISAA